ncbi:hypothetical protein MCERE19_01529 [Spirosomataceae bacterium]
MRTLVFFHELIYINFASKTCGLYQNICLNFVIDVNE